jgi:hypothetical protein
MCPIVNKPNLKQNQRKKSLKIAFLMIIFNLIFLILDVYVNGARMEISLSIRFTFSMIILKARVVQYFGVIF